MLSHLGSGAHQTLLLGELWELGVCVGVPPKSLGLVQERIKQFQAEVRHSLRAWVQMEGASPPMRYSGRELVDPGHPRNTLTVSVLFWDCARPTLRVVVKIKYMHGRHIIWQKRSMWKTSYIIFQSA